MRRRRNEQKTTRLAQGRARAQKRRLSKTKKERAESRSAQYAAVPSIIAALIQGQAPRAPKQKFYLIESGEKHEFKRPGKRRRDGSFEMVSYFVPVMQMIIIPSPGAASARKRARPAIKVA